jgi:hypothetical protein
MPGKDLLVLIDSHRGVHCTLQDFQPRRHSTKKAMFDRQYFPNDSSPTAESSPLALSCLKYCSSCPVKPCRIVVQRSPSKKSAGLVQRLAQVSARCGRRIAIVVAGQELDRISMFFRSIIFSRADLWTSNSTSSKEASE